MIQISKYKNVIKRVGRWCETGIKYYIEWTDEMLGELI